MKHLSDSLNSTPVDADTDLDSKSAWRRAVYWMLGLVVLAWVVVVLAWSALHIFIVPRIGDYREMVQQQASRAMGVRLEIGSLRVDGGWWVPWLEVSDVRLFDREGREALHLPRVLAAVSPRSLLRGHLEQLTVDRPELEIRRDAQGHVWVAGLDVATEGDGQSADWFFSQPQFVVRQGVVHWRDDSRSKDPQINSPVLTLRDVDVSVQNQWFSHDVRVDVTPPDALGQRISVRGKFQQTPWQRAGDWNQWSGEMFADMPHVDLASLRQWVAMDKGMSLQEGRGAIRMWTDVRRGQAVGMTADVAVDAVDVRLGADLKPLSLRHVHGRLGGQWLDGEVEISSQDLVFETKEGERWPGGVLRVGWRGESFESGTLHAERLDLDALNQISQRLPLPEFLRSTFARMQPQGQMNQLKATWQRQADASLHYTLRGHVRQFTVQRDQHHQGLMAQLPGIENAQIEFDANESGGKARVGIHQGGLTLPGGLDEPRIALTDASVQLAWQMKANDVSVQFTQGHLKNDDLSGEFNGHWKTGDGAQRFPGVLDLTGSFSHAQVAHVHRYLPNTLPAEVRAYVRQAVLGGEGTHGVVRLRGNLNDMPFENPKLGEFRVSTQIARGTFAYVPPPAVRSKGTPEPVWPALKDLTGELVFERSGLRFSGHTQLAGAPDVIWQKVDAHVPTLANPVVSVTGEARGPLKQVLEVIAKSALNDLTGTVLSKSQATGDANYKLGLTLPISQLKNTKVQGSVVFADNGLQVIPGTPVLNRTRGTLHFNELGFKLKAVQAQLLGGETSLEGGLSFAANADQSPLQLKIKGELTADGLRQAKELGFISRLAQRAKGKSEYSATVGLRRGEPEILITSNLKGMALSLPAPLTKPAATLLPLRVETQLTRESLQPKARVLQDQIKVTLDRMASVIYVRELGGAAPRVLRGGIAIGSPAFDNVTLRDSGVSLNLQLPMVDIDAWNVALTELTGATLLKRKATKATVIGAEADGESAQDYLPSFATLQADQVKVSERLIHKVVVGGSRQKDVWRLNISADELNGSAEVRAASANAPAQLYARLAFLNIPPSLVPDVERLLSEQPSSIPTLDIVVSDLTLRGKKLGRLEIDAVNRAGTNASREWRLNKFNVTLPEATLQANGSWVADGPRQRRTQMNFVLAVRNSGDLISRLGTPEAVRGGEGRLEGQVSWQGSPITLHYPSLSGKINMAIEKGQFLKTEPGAARLLGVLNLQALPRRLTLDFNDIFSEGFAFDFVRGDIRIEQGVAFTNNLQMKGVVAGALIEGSADIAHETQDLKVVVVPEINAGTASLYVATINPLIGLTSYLAQMVLSKPLVRAGTTEFRVDGTWANPRVTKVE